MPRALRRSARLRNKSTTYTDPATEDEESSDYSSESEYAQSQSPSDNEQTHCICNKPQDNRLMICCDTCNIWYHHNCVNLSKSKANKLSNSNSNWYCPSCTKKKHKKKSKKKKKKKRKRKKSKHKKSKNKKRKRNLNLDNNKSTHDNINSPPNKRRRIITTTTIIAPSVPQEAIRTLFTNLSAQNTDNQSFECPFLPPPIAQDENTQNTQDTQDTQDTVINNVDIDGNENNNTDTDLEILSNINNENNDNKELECEDCESESDDDILIAAGDKWIKSQSFMENQELFKKDIFAKKKEEINKCIDSDIDLGDKDFVVLNSNKICKQDVCPLTQRKIKNPLKNVLCPHVYEKDAIQKYKQYLVDHEKELKCPQAGCTKYLFV